MDLEFPVTVGGSRGCRVQPKVEGDASHRRHRRAQTDSMVGALGAEDRDEELGLTNTSLPKPWFLIPKPQTALNPIPSTK